MYIHKRKLLPLFAIFFACLTFLAPPLRAQPPARRAPTPLDKVAGLWKQEGLATLSHEVFFDCDNREVILITSDSQGVYTWESLERSPNGGVSLIASNMIIGSIKQRFDIELKTPGTLSLRVRENVGLAPSNSAWDGVYKVVLRSHESDTTAALNTKVHLDFALSLCRSVWLDDNGTEYTFNGNSFTASKGQSRGEGVFIMDTVGELPCVQFRPSRGHTRLNGGYALQFEKVGGSVTNNDTILLVPVKLSALECTPDNGLTISLHKKQEFSDSDYERLQKTRLDRFTM